MKCAKWSLVAVACLAVLGCEKEVKKPADANAGTKAAATSTYPAAQKIVDAIVANNPEIVRLTIHAVPTGKTENIIVASSVPAKLGKVSDPEDVAAMTTGKTTVLIEGENLDVTAPVLDKSGKAIAATGITLSGAGGATADPAKKAALEQKAKAIAAELTAVVQSAKEPLW